MTDIEYFEHYVFPEPSSGCWLWAGSINKLGYGVVNRRGRKTSAHREAWRLYRGPFTNFAICHKCDLPCCCNPDHLFEGSQKDNIQDAMSKNRMKVFGKGDDHPDLVIHSSKLRIAAERRDNGERLRDIARDMAVSYQTLKNGLRYRTY